MSEKVYVCVCVCVGARARASERERERERKKKNNNENICGRNEEHRNREGKEDERQIHDRMEMAALGRADCLFVGSSQAHKQVKTNNILAALRQGVDGEPRELDVCS